MTRAKVFRLLIVIQVIFTIMFYTIPIELTFYMSPFYIAGMAIGCFLMLKAIVYTCPHCGKHQIMLGFFDYRLPTDSCYTCYKKIDL